MQRAADFQRPVQSASASGTRTAGDVHVALVRPHSAERAAPERQRLEVGHDAAASGAWSGTRSSMALRGVAGERGRCRARRCANRARTRDRAGTRPSGTRAANAASDSGIGRTFSRDPLTGPLLVHIDGAAVHDRVRMAEMALPGTIQIVDNVAARVRTIGRRRSAPRSVALSGGETAEECYAAVRAAGPGLVGCRRVHRRRAVRAGRPIPTPTRAWPAGCCSIDVQPARDPLDVSARRDRGSRAALRRSRCAPRRRSISCTSASAPMAIPPRSFPAARRSPRTSASSSRPATTEHPDPRLDLHVSRDRPEPARGRDRCRGRQAGSGRTHPER